MRKVPERMTKPSCLTNKLLNALLLLFALNYTNLSHATSDTHEANLEFVTAKQLEDSIQLNKAYDKYQHIAKQYQPSTIALLSSIRLDELKSQVFRNGVKVDHDKYPQDSQLALAKSVVKALSSHDFSYFLAHLAIPKDEALFYTGLDGSEYKSLSNQLTEMKPIHRERLIKDYKAIVASLENGTKTSSANQDSHLKNSPFRLTINDCLIIHSTSTCYNYRNDRGTRYIILEQAGRYYFSGI